MWWVWANCEERCLPSPSTGRVKLIRVCLGVADGLSALSSVCIRGSQPPTVLLPPPQHHSTHCQPCLDCTSLSSLPLSSTLLFSLLFLYVCASLSFGVPDPYCSIKKPYCSPRGILSAPMPVYITGLPLALILLNIHFLHFATENLDDDYFTNKKNIAGSYCVPGIQMIWCICINRL